jgi:hypothetical protein
VIPRQSIPQPPKILDNSAAVDAGTSDVEKKLVDSGTEVFVSSPEEFARFIAGETRSWRRILTGISI